MHRRRKPIKFLFLSITALPIIGFLVYNFPPDLKMEIGNWKLEIMYLFLPLLFLFIFSLTTYFSKNTKHGLLLGLFVVSLLTFRMSNLTHPFFLLLLAAFFLMLELLFSYRK
jgi:hypothetical protein